MSEENFSLVKYDCYREGEYIRFENKQYHSLFFLLKGSGALFIGDEAEQSIGPESFIWINKDIPFTFEVLQNTEVILFRFDKVPVMVDKCYNLTNLTFKPPEHLYSNIYPFCVALESFLCLLCHYVQSEIGIKDIYPHKLKELFLIFHHYYSQNEIYQLISQVKDKL